MCFIGMGKTSPVMSPSGLNAKKKKKTKKTGFQVLEKKELYNPTYNRFL